MTKVRKSTSPAILGRALTWLLCAIFALSLGVPAKADAIGQQALGLAVQAKAQIGAPANVRNWSMSNTLGLRGVIGKVLGGYPQTVAFVGDSTTAGFYASHTGTASFAYSFPTQLATLLNPLVPTSNDATFGTQTAATVTDFTTFDTRWVIGAGWATSVNSVGGPVLYCPNTCTTTGVFTPVGAWDTATIYYLQGSGNATFTVKSGGTTLQTVNTSGSTAVTSVTVTKSLGTGDITLQRNGTGSGLFLIGIDAYNSAAPKLRFYNMGWSGSDSTNWVPGTGNAWDPVTVLQQLAPNLTVINLTINDELHATPIATYTAKLQTLVNAATAGGGSVLMMVGVPSQTTSIPAATQATYAAAFAQVAASNNIPLLDTTARWGSYTASSPLYFNSLHPNTQGMGDLASFVFSVVKPQ